DITAYEPATGKVLWTLTDRGASDTASPAQGNGLLFVPAREFVALKPGQDGATPEVAWKSNKLRSGGASPLYHDGAVYGLADIGLTCLDAKDGSVKWLQRVPGKFWASPVIADGKAYVTDETGKVTVIQLGEKPDILATNDVGQKLLATPAIAN